MNTKQKGLSSSSHFLSICGLILICDLAFAHSDCKNPVIFNFGDSNSDTGGLTAGLGLEVDYPYGRAFFRPPTGRATDGRLVIDFFCEFLGTHYLSPYLDSLQPDFTNGVNFAICGSCTLPRSFRFNLNVQLQQFKHFRRRSLELYSKGRSNAFKHLIGIKNLVGNEDFKNALYSLDIGQNDLAGSFGSLSYDQVIERIPKNALYTLDIGQNDLAGSFGSLSYDQVIERIPSFISEIRGAMWDIYEVGGRNFWVHNTGPLGCLPEQLAARYNTNSSYDEYGCLESLNEGAKAFNNQLNALCEQLRSEMENSTIVYVDVYSIKYDLIANATSYGFKNPLMACCGHGGEPYNYDPEFTCLGGGYTVCEEGSTKQYINWDGTHYTEAANSIIASKILSTHYSKPPLQFNFFCTDPEATSLISRS